MSEVNPESHDQFEIRRANMWRLLFTGTINELRAYWGLEPIAGGDQLNPIAEDCKCCSPKLQTVFDNEMKSTFPDV